MRSVAWLAILSLLALTVTPAAADPVVLSGFDAEEEGGKSGANNNNGWQLLQDLFFRLGTLSTVTNQRLVVLDSSLPSNNSTTGKPDHHPQDGDVESAILNAFVYTVPWDLDSSNDELGDGNGDHGINTAEDFLGLQPNWKLSFVSDVTDLLNGTGTGTATTSFVRTGDRGQFTPYSNETIDLTDVGMIYVRSSSGVAGALDNPGLAGFLAGGGVLLVGAGNYGAWLSQIGLGAGNAGVAGAGTDSEQGDWSSTAGPLLAARDSGNLVYSAVQNTIDVQDTTVELPYNDVFTGFGSLGYVPFGTDGNTVYAISRGLTAAGSPSADPIPEPGSIVLCGLGLGLACWLRRRRSQRAA